MALVSVPGMPGTFIDTETGQRVVIRDFKECRCGPNGPAGLPGGTGSVVHPECQLHGASSVVARRPKDKSS